MIRLQVPIDLTTVRETASSAFSAITPMRVDTLLALAVVEALGPRAPSDKRARCLRSTVDGLARGSFVVDIDGRIFSRPDDVVACADQVTLRFFSSADRSRPLRRDAWPQGTRPPGIS